PTARRHRGRPKMLDLSRGRPRARSVASSLWFQLRALAGPPTRWRSPSRRASSRPRRENRPDGVRERETATRRVAESAPRATGQAGSPRKGPGTRAAGLAQVGEHLIERAADALEILLVLYEHRQRGLDQLRVQAVRVQDHERARPIERLGDGG